MAKSRKVRYESEALAEVVAAVTWYRRRRRSLGPAFKRAVRERLKLLLQFPGLGELVDDQNRVAQVDGFPYLIAYQEVEGGILVLAVAHSSREPGYWQDRQ